ncbi:uncharacterized protein TEOVI_000607900 [Trypanosoma equiperdum]|nr:hypothetical protein, conserved [Trypanosoma equiperdum]
MSSYCDICRRLDVPHHHGDEGNATGGATNRRPSPAAAEIRWSAVTSRHSSRNSDGKAWVGGRSRENRQSRGFLDRHFQTQSVSRNVSPAIGVDRGTVCSLLRKASTPHCSPSKSEPSSGPRRNQTERVAEPLPRRDQLLRRQGAAAHQGYAAKERQPKVRRELDVETMRSQSTVLSEDLKGMLEQLREAVRREKCGASAFVSDDGNRTGNSKCGENFPDDGCPRVAFLKCESAPLQSTSVALAVAPSTDVRLARKGDDNSSSSSYENPPSSGRDRSRLTLFSQSNFCSAAVATPAKFTNVVDSTPCSVKPAGDGKAGVGDNPSVSSSASDNDNSGSILKHIEVLRSGFADLCGAVREDLHALHARVDDLQRQQKRQQSMLDDLARQQPTWARDGGSSGEASSPVVYNEVVAELQQYIVDTVHRVVRQQPRTTWVGGAKCGEASGKRHRSTLCSPLANASPVDEKCGDNTVASVGTATLGGCTPDRHEVALKQHVHSVVRAVLNEFGFPVCVSELVERQKSQQREMRAMKREYHQRCTAVEEKLRLTLAAAESTHLKSHEFRTSVFVEEFETPAGTEAAASAPQPQDNQPQQHQSSSSFPLHPPPAQTSSAEAAGDTGTASQKHLLDVLMRRIQRVTDAYEERCLQRVNLEAVQPLAEHVRRLMSAHQSMIDTIVESRCDQLDGRISSAIQQQQMQLKELRSKLSGLRVDVHSALKDLSEKLNVACPGL